MKKFLASLILFSLILGLSLPAFAKESEKNRNNKIKTEDSKNIEVKAEKNKEKEEKSTGINRAIEARLTSLIRRLNDDKKISPEVIRNLTLFLERFRSGNGTSTGTTTDLLAPKILNLKVTSLTPTSARISFATNELASTSLWYSTSSSPFDLGKLPVLNSTSSTTHNFTLTNLSPDTKYFYQVRATDTAGNSRLSSLHSFRTKATTSVDTLAPTISFLASFNTTGSTTDLILVSSEKTRAQAWVSTTSTVSATGTPNVKSDELSFFHKLSLSNLATSTIYYYLVSVSDQAGNTSTSSIRNFSTLAN